MSASEPLIPELPALEAVLKWYDARRRLPFQGMKVLATQHVLGSTLSLFRAVEICGVAAADIHLVAKAYSSNAFALEAAMARGYRIFGGTPMTTDSSPYEEELARAVREAVHHLSASRMTRRAGDNAHKSVLIVDDGGLSFDTLLAGHPELAGLSCGVEQTTRGIRSLSVRDLDIPIANVGRCQAKLEVEAGLIAESMVDNLALEIEKLSRMAVPIGGRVLLVGYGAVGERVAEALRLRHYEVAVSEDSPSRLARAAAAGLPILPLPAALKGRNIICGATGTSWFPVDWIDLVEPGSLLVNMGSSDIEFAAWRLRPIGRPLGPGRDRRVPWAQVYRIDRSQGSVWLAKGGFPVNHTGGADPIDPMKIQLTRALLLAGALEAVIAPKPGLFLLPDVVQELIISTSLEPARK
jgi:S-adenosylhomocysteine hydrolase